MPRVSVVTAVHPEKTEYLNAAHQSLLRQRLPRGWDWEWLVQQDGAGMRVAAVLSNPDPRIKLGSNRVGGPAIARTMALSRAVGDLVRVFDADDELPEGALERDIKAIINNKGVLWTTSRVLDLLPDGSTVGFDDDPPPGVIRRGDVFAYWLDHDYRASVHPATLCITKSLLLILGGWMALPASEDTGLLLALNAVSTGYFISDPGLYYRKWPGQSTASSAHVDPTERTDRMRLIAARTHSLLQTGDITALHSKLIAAQ